MNAQPRKPYERPAIVYEEKLESVAAVCGPPTGKAVGVCTIGFS